VSPAQPPRLSIQHHGVLVALSIPAISEHRAVSSLVGIDRPALAFEDCGRARVIPNGDVPADAWPEPREVRYELQNGVLDALAGLDDGSSDGLFGQGWTAVRWSGSSASGCRYSAGQAFPDSLSTPAPSPPPDQSST